MYIGDLGIRASGLEGLSRDLGIQGFRDVGFREEDKLFILMHTSTMAIAHVGVGGGIL